MPEPLAVCCTGHSWVRPLAVIATVLSAIFLHGCERSGPSTQRVRFTEQAVDRAGVADPWGKGSGDLNGDGRIDVVVGSQGGDGLVWYENPGWQRRAVSRTGEWSTDVEVGDIGGDGNTDVVAIGRHEVAGGEDGIVIFHGPDWVPAVVDRQKLHDIALADLDRDGRPDIVGRGQSAFGGGGDRVLIYVQRSVGGFVRTEVPVTPGEGLAVGDIDADGYPDIVVDGQWLRNPGGATGEWTPRRYTNSWRWPHTVVALGDINSDGRADIVLTPAELAGQRNRISWFESPGSPDSATEWVEHVVAEDVEAVHHSLVLADFDKDGRFDLATAVMQQGHAPQEVAVYFNDGFGTQWTRQALAAGGSHNLLGADFDADGDIDLVGANWSGSGQPVKWWRNETCSPGKGCPRWRRHALDEERPGPAAFVLAADVDRDGLTDIGSGGWWYRNPGRPVGAWQRTPVGGEGTDLAAFVDLDGDALPDALCTRWPGEYVRARWPNKNKPVELLVAQNKGGGQFRVSGGLPPVTGDFLQGVATDRFDGTSRLQVSLSWHGAGHGVQLLSQPLSQDAGQWTLETISEFSQDEALSAGDINADGRVDLLLGTAWLENTGTAWLLHWIDRDTGSPDRNRLADINGDGRLDAVVGFEAISRAGPVVWYEAGSDPLQPWTRHEIATVVGPMSVGVADMDGDGAQDVVVGEHDLKSPGTARMMIFFNSARDGLSWRQEVVHTGDEHHDGALTVDLDGDGDVDIVSIGWGHQKVVWYENLAHP